MGNIIIAILTIGASLWEGQKGTRMHGSQTCPSFGGSTIFLPLYIIMNFDLTTSATPIPNFIPECM